VAQVPFAAWLMRIAHNEVISFARRNGRRSSDTELPEDLLDKGNNDPAENAERQLALEDLRKAVDLLPEAQREVIILRFAAGLSVADTAKALGKQENNVKVLQHKGMQRLQVLMTPKYPELAPRPFDKAQDKPFDRAQDKPLGHNQDRPFGKARDRHS
jgi:RNA polymerase sigma-70 factor (ECF subfamily)